MHLVPAPAVRLMKRRVLSRPGVNRVSRCDDRAGSLIPSIKGVFDCWGLKGDEVESY